MSAACFWPITPDYLRKLLAAGADLSLVDKVSEQTLVVHTPQTIVCRSAYGHSELLCLLHNQQEGKSALALAIDDGFTEAAKVLQQAAADAGNARTLY